MAISLHTFEQQIPPNTLKAGLNLFESGQVEGVESAPGGQLTAQVWDGEMYEVHLTLAQEAVQQWVCSCDTPNGKVCDHLTALIFKLVASHLGMVENPNAETKKSKKKQEKPAAKKIKPPKAGPFQALGEVLNRLPAEQLTNIILNKAESDPAFLMVLMAEFASLSDGEPLPLYNDLLDNLLKKIKGRKQSMKAEEVKFFCEALSPFMTQIGQQIKMAHYDHAAHMLAAVASTFATLIDLMVKKVAAFTKLIEHWRQLNLQLHAVVSSGREEEVRLYVFRHAVAGISPHSYRQAQVAVFYAQWASAYCKYSEDVVLLDQNIQQFMAKGWYLEMHADLQVALMHAYERVGDQQTVRDMKLRLQFSASERQKMVEQCMEAGQIADAIVLLEKGLEDNVDDDHLWLEWQNLLLVLYERNGQIAEGIGRARRLLVEEMLTDSEVLIRFMKKHVGAAQWPAFKAALVAELEQDVEQHFYSLFELHMFDNDLKAALASMQLLVKKDVNAFDTLHLTRWELFKPYAKEATQLLVTATKQKLKVGYAFQKAAIIEESLKGLQQLGNKSVSLQFVYDLLKKYPYDRQLTKKLNAFALQLLKLKDD